MAATADLNTISRSPGLVAYLLASAAVIYAGTLVTLNTAGAAVAGADTDGYRFVGIAVAGVDEAEDDTAVEVYTSGEFLLTGAGFAATDVGKPVYLVDDATVGLIADASVDNDIRVGIITEYVSATQAWVRIESVGARAAKGEVRQYTVEVAGTNATAIPLADRAALFGGAGFYVNHVTSVRSVVTSTGAASTPSRKVLTTHFTLASGAITPVGDETLNTWLITFQGYLT